MLDLPVRHGLDQSSSAIHFRSHLSLICTTNVAPDQRGVDPKGGLTDGSVSRDQASLERRLKGRRDILSQKCDRWQENDAGPDKMCCKSHGMGGYYVIVGNVHMKQR